MKYLSICSGIEAATSAWHPLGWGAVGFSEIEPFPSAVLKHHYPQITNYGDMTKYETWNIQSGTVDLLVGGTPCQSFSVAGLRQGLKDPRGNLMLTFLGIAERIKPRWIVWENVPGVLSSNGGKDFGSFLGALGELGYGWAYRVLDAQWFGVAQRRRRVFVVGCLGDGQSAAKVLFESESVRRNPAPSREKGKGIASNVEEGLGDIGKDKESVAENYWTNQDAPCETILARDYKGIGNQDLSTGRLLVKSAIPIHDQATRNAGKRGDKQDGKGNGLGVGKPGDPCPTLTKGDKHAVLYENHPNDSRVTGPHEVAPACVSRFGTGGGNVPLVQEAIVFQESELRLTGKITEQNVVPTLKANTKAGDTEPKVVAFEPGIAKREGNESRFVEEMSPTLRKDMGDNQVAVAKQSMAVRRLTPKECERLQGFPDDHTLISWRGKPADQCPDGPRYKALGNSMAVPCMAWIGRRIDAIEKEKTK